MTDLTLADMPDPLVRSNRQVVLRHRPDGMLKHDDVEVVDGPMPELGDGQVLIRMVYLQMDAAVRSWLDEGEGYLPAVEIGAPVRGGGMGRIIESRHPDYTPGMWCGGGLPGWQDWVVADGDDPFVNAFPADHDAVFQIAVIASAAATAYFGLTDLGEIEEGDSVLISAAAGSTGSVAVQTARNLGATVVGIAGSDEKCRWVESIGAEVCLNRRTEDLAARLKEIRPKGFDIYFDNVGGDILDLALRRLAIGARVVIIGAISMYNEKGRPPGPSNYLNLINKQAKMVGFQGMAYVQRYPEAWDRMWEWRREGKMDFEIDLRYGLENCVDQLNALFTGANTGKAMVQIAEDPGPGPY
ncbi:MAG: NADP-dependent oxidoreductase [Acidimicrobiales bacterium]|nr:NADP-dependent oxidoreductase [Acidimicrobiales bacterium]